MVQFQSDFENSDSLLHPFESPTAQQNEENYDAEAIQVWEGKAYSRLKRLINRSGGSFASDTGITDIFSELNGNKLDLKTNSNVAKIKSAKSAEKLVDDMAKAVDTVLETTMNDGIAELSRASAISASIDRPILNETYTEVWNYISQEKRAGVESLMATQAEISFLKQAETQAGEEWEKIVDRNQEFLNKYKDLGKIWAVLGAGVMPTSWVSQKLRDKKLFRKEALKFTELSNEMRQRLDDKFAGMNDRADETEKRNRDAVEKMAQSVDRQFQFASDKDKEAMWKQVTDLLDEAKRSGGNIFNLKLTPKLFGINGRQEIITFLEAIKQLQWVRDGVAAKFTTESLYQASSSTIEAAETLDEEMRNPAPGFEKIGKDFQELEGHKEFSGISPAETSVTLSALVENIWDDISFHGKVDMEQFFGGHQIADLLGDASKMRLILQQLFSGVHSGTGESYLSFLEPQTKRKLLRWIKDLDEKTNKGIEGEYKNEETTKQLNILRKQNREGLVGEAQRILERVFDLQFDNGENFLDFDRLQRDVREFSATCLIKKQEFENIEEDLAEKDREVIKELWKQVEKARTALLEFVPKWTQKKEKWESEEKYKGKISTFLKQSIEKAQERERGYVQTNKKIIEVDKWENEKEKSVSVIDSRSSNRIEADFQEFRKELEIFSGEREELRTVFDDMVRAGSKKIEITPNRESSKPIPLYRRIQRELYQQFSTQETEQRFLERMSQYDAYETIKYAPVGAKVKLSYKVISRNQLKFPSELKGAEDDQEFTIVQTNDQGVEMASNDKRIRIVHALVEMSGKEPKVWKNMSIAEKNKKDDTTAKNIQTGIAYNLRLA